MKLHPLHTADAISQYVQATGAYYPVDRQTGRSTALAHKLIARAIETPYMWFNVTDHHGSAHSNKLLLDLCRDITIRLEYKHFHFKDCAICFGDPR